MFLKLFAIITGILLNICSFYINVPNVKENITSSSNNLFQKSENNNSINDLFIDDYYANYYFHNLTENYGFNKKGSCTQIALAQLLSYLDTYWDDSIIPENYEAISNEFSYTSESPGIKCEEKINNDISNQDYYWNYVDKMSNEFFHYFLIKLGYENFGYYDFNSEVPCALYDGQINKIAEYYLYDFLGKNKSDYVIETNRLHESPKSFAIENVKKGIPVLVRCELSGIGGHAMIAYDYNEDWDELYFHNGLKTNETHCSAGSLNVIEYYDAMTIVPKTNHSHTSNYFLSNQSKETVCPCRFVIPTKIEVVNHNLDTWPTYSWNSLIKENWFKNIGLHHEFCILNSNRQVELTVNNLYDNSYGLGYEEWEKIFEIADPEYYVYIGLASEIDPFWDDYYCVQSFREPCRYKYKFSILPSDWGFDGRYYFSNELEPEYLLNNPERKNKEITIDGFNIATERLRCGYIENSFIVLSPRRENAGRAYFEMIFDRKICTFMYRACLWSGNEKIDGSAIIQIADANGNWTKLKDIPLHQLKTKENGLTQFVEETPEGIYGLRFEIESTPEGTRNKGRFCIDDIVFSESKNINTYKNYDYSTKL